MSWTKKKLVEHAYDELALSGYVFDLSPEEYAYAARKLESMIAMWGADGLPLPYALDASDEPDLDAESGLPLVATSAVYLGLAKIIAASKGKQLSPGTLAAAYEAKNALIGLEVGRNVGQQQQKAGMPLGAGRKSWGYYGSPFATEPDTDPLRIEGGGGLEFNGA